MDEASSVERLWEEFKLKASSDARERLILHYAPLVKYVAGRVSVGLPPNIEQADLVSYGIFGLIDAIEKFDPERGIKFETYAISRIKGAIIDELHHIFNQISFVSVVALDELLTVGSERGDRLSLVDTLEDKGAEDPVAAFETEEMKSILTGAINRLAEREKIVITLYYYEGLTLAEIGQVLGVTESRVCQMHTKAVLQLRGKMQDVR